MTEGEEEELKDADLGDVSSITRQQRFGVSMMRTTYQITPGCVIQAPIDPTKQGRLWSWCVGDRWRVLFGCPKHLVMYTGFLRRAAR